MHTAGGQGREALRGSPPATKTSLPLNPTSYRTAAPYFPQAFSGKWEKKWLWVPRILFHPGILSCSLCLFAQICSAIVQTAGKHRWWQTRRFLVLGQRYYAALTRANARRVKSQQGWIKKIFSLQPLFIYIYGLQLCLPPDYKPIPAAPCKRARAWLNFSEYFRYKIILPLAWTLNETIPMLRKGCLTSAFIFCTLQLCHKDIWYRKKPLFTTRDLWCGQKWRGNDSWCLEITLQLPSHTTTWETVSCFLVLFAEKKKSIFPSFPRSLLSSSVSLRMQLYSLYVHKWVIPQKAGDPAQSFWVNEKWGKLGDCFVKISAVAQVFSWSSLEWLGSLAVKDQPFYLLLELLCLPFGEVLFLLDRQCLKGSMQPKTGPDTGLWSYWCWKQANSGFYFAAHPKGSQGLVCMVRISHVLPPRKRSLTHFSPQGSRWDGWAYKPIPTEAMLQSAGTWGRWRFQTSLFDTADVCPDVCVLKQ